MQNFIATNVGTRETLDVTVIARSMTKTNIDKEYDLAIEIPLSDLICRYLSS